VKNRSCAILSSMKIIVTHTSPDWDAIGSVWLLRKYLPGWHDAKVEFVPAGQRYKNQELRITNQEEVIENYGSDEVIHVDTGLGPLDHHQTSDRSVSGTSRVWDYVKLQRANLPVGKAGGEGQSEKVKDRDEAIGRIVQYIVDTDHFKEVFFDNPASDYHEFSILGLLEGLKLYKPDEDDYYVEFGIECLESLLRTFENRIWAEEEIKKAQKFQTRWGKGLAFETINDTVLKLAQKMGYVLVVRKDPRKGYVRIKARPTGEMSNVKYPMSNDKLKHEDVDLTLAYEKLSKIDPEATWFLHVSKKMLLNGTPKNPKMVPTKLTLSDIIQVLETI